MNISENICNSLMQEIREEKYTNDTPLPSLRKLAHRYNTSVTTVRTALQILQSKNLIVAYQGKGYFSKTKHSDKNRKLILILNRPGEMYEAMQEALLQLKSEYSGIYIVFETINQRKEKLQESIEHMIADGLDTIFLNSITINQLDFIENYRSIVDIYGFFYLSNNLTHASFLPGVYSDWYHGGYIGVRHLIDCGCKKILLILSSQGSIQSDCLAGAICAAEDAPPGVKVNVVYDYDLDVNTKYNIEDLSEHLKNDVTGIFCFTHSIAFRVYDYLKSNNYRIPQDVAVLEYYDSSLSLEFSPPLSSISLCPETISRELLKMYKSGNKQVITIKPKLIKRASTLRTSD